MLVRVSFFRANPQYGMRKGKDAANAEPMPSFRRDGGNAKDARRAAAGLAAGSARPPGWEKTETTMALAGLQEEQMSPWTPARARSIGRRLLGPTIWHRTALMHRSQ